MTDTNVINVNSRIKAQVDKWAKNGFVPDNMQLPPYLTWKNNRRQGAFPSCPPEVAALVDIQTFGEMKGRDSVEVNLCRWLTRRRAAKLQRLMAEKGMDKYAYYHDLQMVIDYVNAWTAAVPHLPFTSPRGQVIAAIDDEGYSRSAMTEAQAA